jgi:hypothetical protein
MAKIYRQGKGSFWEQGAVIKTNFYKMPTNVETAGIGSDGYYLFNSTTQLRDYLIVGDSPKDISRWVEARDQQQGFWHQVGRTTEEREGHDPLWDAGYSYSPQPKANFTARATVSIGASSARFTHGQTATSAAEYGRCAWCGKDVTAAERQGKVPVHAATAVHHADRHKNRWYCDEGCLEAERSKVVVAKGTVSSSPKYGQQTAAVATGVGTITAGPIYLRGTLLVRNGNIQSLTPMADVTKAAVQGVAALAPGGSASLAGEIALDVVGAANDGYANIKSYLRRSGGEKDPNLAPCLVVSVSSENEARSVGNGNGTGQVTFANIQQNQNYPLVIEALNQLWANTKPR